MTLKIITTRCKILRTPCTHVEDIDEDIRKLVINMIRTMREEDGMTLSANQVSRSESIFITNIPGDHIRIFINPILEGTGGGDIDTYEGCLSFGGKRLHRQRKRHAVIRAFNLKGEQFIVDTRYKLYSESTSSLVSTCLQHSMDHINGIDMRPYIA